MVGDKQPIDKPLSYQAFFCNMVYQGGWLPPPYELEIDGPKV